MDKIPMDIFEITLTKIKETSNFNSDVKREHSYHSFHHQQKKVRQTKVSDFFKAIREQNSNPIRSRYH